MSNFNISARVALVAMVSLLIGSVSAFARGIDTSQYSVSVDYGQSVGASLQSGSYGWVQYRISSTDFPDSMTSGTATLNAKLVLFDAGWSVDQFIKDQAAAGFRPATLKELLAFGKAYPDRQKDTPIIALGSTVTEPLLAYNTVQSGQARVDADLYPVLGDNIFGRTVEAAWPNDNENGSPHTYGEYYALMIQK